MTASMPTLERVRLATEADHDKFIYTHSICEAVATCPTWGIVRQVLRKTYSNTARAMALEAGSALHEVFAMTRIWQLASLQNEPALAVTTLKRLFPLWHDRFDATNDSDLVALVTAPDRDQARDHLIDLCFRTLHTSDWYDDPSDRVRTMTGFEAATIVYIDEFMLIADHYPIWISPDRTVAGIELVIDAILEYSDGTNIRYAGTLDGLAHRLDRSPAFVHLENKTGVRLGDGWEAAFAISHQVSGYHVLASCLTNDRVLNGRIFGLKVKPSGSEDYKCVHVARDHDRIASWAAFVYYINDLVARYRDDPCNAPQFSHSCSRYFRPCSMIPFCDSSPESRRIQLEDDMVEAAHSPTVMEVVGR